MYAIYTFLFLDIKILFAMYGSVNLKSYPKNDNDHEKDINHGIMHPNFIVYGFILVITALLSSVLIFHKESFAYNVMNASVSEEVENSNFSEGQFLLLSPYLTDGEYLLDNYT